jgi:transposase
MNKTRREFKQEAVALLRPSGRPLTQVAGELGIQPSMLRSWRDGRLARYHGRSLLRQARGPSLRHLAQHLRQRIRPPRLRACAVSWSAHALSVTF